MVNASFGIIDTELAESFRFRDRTWDHLVSGLQVTASTNFSRRRQVDNVEIIDGSIVDYKLGYETKTIANPGETPYIQRNPKPVAIGIQFQILNRKYVKTSTHSEIITALNNLNMALPRKTFFHYVWFDIAALNRDYPNQWFADIHRGGEHAETIKAKGDNLVKDDKIGGEDFKTFLKNDIGITCQIGDSSVKIQISNNGLIQIPSFNKSNYQPNGNEINEFFLNTLLPYSQVGQRARKPRNY